MFGIVKKMFLVLLSIIVKVLCYLQMKKCDSLFYKINTFLQKTTTSIRLQRKIFYVNI